MPIWKPDTLEISPEDVIRGQGADPEIIRNRRPQLFDSAKKAIELGQKHIKPQVLYEEFVVEGMLHEKLKLAGGATLSGALIAEHLANAEKVIILIGTVGPEIDAYANQMMMEDPVLGLAVDGFGGAAVEKLANAACTMFEIQAAEHGMQTSVPLSPGMIGWDVGKGQPQIFKALPADEIGVQLTQTSLMLPKKSLTLALGFGKDLEISGSTCDYCTMKETCNYRGHYPPH